MTNNFHKVIGRGGSGSVYQGCLTNGTLVAVKILDPSSKNSFKQFCTEAQLLTRFHHRNLVALVGYCEEDTNMALIYEFVSNGNLQQRLSEKNVKVPGWKVRLQIAVDTAQGLEYMHNGCNPPIIHRDMKSSNILLDNELNAKISDFGLSRPFLDDSESTLRTGLAGTYGYVDPEYLGSGRLSVSSDVYSFGVVLLELITGQPCIIKGTENCNIVSWVTPMLERGDIHNIVERDCKESLASTQHGKLWRLL